MEYKFRVVELNRVRGVIGEHLARSFIRNTLAPRLVKEEGWDHVLLSRNNYKQHFRSWARMLFSFDYFREDFMVHGFHADMKLLAKYATAVGVLRKNHCTPDSILLKLLEVGRTKKLDNISRSVTRILRTRFKQKTEGLEVPIVRGDLEMVEIKCGRTAKLMDNQKLAYNDLIAKGIPLRLIKVRIASFDLNRFLVVQRKVEKPL